MGEHREGKTAEASVLTEIQMKPTEGKGMKSGGEVEEGVPPVSTKG